MPQKPMNDDLFIRYFTVRYQLYKLTNYMEHTPELEETDSYLHATDFARAWMMGIIPTEEVYREMMGRISSPSQIKAITMVLNDNVRFNKEKERYADIKNVDFSLFRSLAQKIVERILEIELKRGDSETQVTSLAEELSYVYGAETFIRILQAFGNYFEDTDIHFNISHSGCYVIAAVSDEDIGIDIQKIKSDKHRIAEKNFLPSECAYINEIEDEKINQQRFCEIWTIKEAYLKNIGIGLRKPLNSFEIDFSEDAPQIVGKKEYKFVQLKFDEKYIVTVCADQSDEIFDVEEVLVV